MNKKQILTRILLLMGIILALSLVSSQSFSGASNAYSRSNVGYAITPGFTPFSGDLQFPLFDRNLCEAGQDFILQINPLGCEPSVVRSDLLEEQNVPVFCPIVATQLNPLVDIEAINNIIFTFAGPKPKEVVGVTYVPARAALGRYGAQLNQPVLNNIGYAVIVLRRQANESAMPEFILGNLTASIRYDVKNAFGVGRANFYLPELSNDDWEENFRQYGFWRGKGYIRADGIDNTGARISIYSDRETYGSGSSGEKRVLQTVNLNVGETSREMFMPGFNYCLGSMQVELNGLENPNTRAKLRINEDVVEVKEGERFLENRCQIRNIVKNGVNERIIISCQEDQKRGSFSMSISPKINLQIEGKVREVSVGDKLYREIIKGSETDKSVYLAYVGTEGNSVSEQNLFIVTVAIPGVRNSLTETQINSFGRFINRFPTSNIDNIFKLTENIYRGGFSSAEEALRFLSGQSFESVPFGETENHFGKNVAIVGFADAINADVSNFPSDLRNYYEKAIKDYDTIIESFPQEQSLGLEDITLGQLALAAKIDFFWDLDQREAVPELCNEFEDTYPGSVAPEVCNQYYKISSTESAIRDVQINGRTSRIVFDRIREPSLDEFSVKILINPSKGDAYSVTLRKNSVHYLNKSTNEFIQLLDLRRDNLDREATATVSVNLLRERRSTTEAIRDFLETSTKRLIKDIPENYGSNKYQFILQEVNLKKLAKVSINPKINYARTNASFNFKIGIEKRAIRLSPEKTRERIESLNKTLEKWQNINGKLGNVVQGLKASCLVTGGVLTFKNFLSNLDGKGIARQKVMRGDNGWFEFCNKKENLLQYDNSVDSCLLDKSDKIDTGIDIISGEIEKQNQEVKTIRAELGKDGEDTEKVLQGYVDADYNAKLSSNLEGVFENDGIKIGNDKVKVSDIIKKIDSDSTYLSQAKNLQLNSRLVNSEDERVREIARAAVKKELADIHVNTQKDVERKSLAEKYGLPSTIGSREGLTKFAVTEIETYGQETRHFTGVEINPDSYVHIYKDPKDAQEYLLVLDNDFVIKQTYKINGNALTVDDPKKNNSLGLFPQRYDSTTYQNQFVDPVVRYYEAGIYAGFPSIVPFDLKEGWYAYVKSTLPVGGAIQSYQASGRVSSFWLCNVGENGRAQFDSGIGDDTCEMINPGTNQLYNQFPGLVDKDEASSLAILAVRAISDAQRAHHDGISTVTITSPKGIKQNIKVGPPALNIPDIQCQDFMSPTDCNLLFNVCDPVICPSSRCDLGGAYPVKDVVQSGIAGSLALCLPNFPEVKVPVCLSGVHAGIDGYLTVLDSYQQCLQASLDTGQTIGVCDEINSIYMCDFFWRQSIPLAKLAITKGLGTALGQDTGGGGGEYLGVANAWDTASQSTEFFTQFYAVNSFQAFKSRSAEDVGTAVCKNFISIAGPSGGNFFDALTAPDSPAQFYGRFDEIPFTTATNPPVSQYKVFYHIYAGKDFPAQYQVYLRGTSGSFYQDASSRRIVAQGFIKAGDYFTETRDFTAPSGHQQMCIIVNGQEECGFKQVTTSFGVNYVTEQYVASQAKQTDINSETACISGTSSIYSLLSPNLQAGATEITNPAIYNRGITRICATGNPGLGTDSLAGTDQSRWQPVGNCGNSQITCWLDTDSVRDTLRNTNIENEVLDKVTPNYLETLQSELGLVGDFDDLVSEINGEGDVVKRIEKITQNINKVFFGNQRGYLIFLRGDAYADLATRLFEKLKPEKTADTEEDGTGEIIYAVTSPVFEFQDGSALITNLFYKYSGGWQWSSDKGISWTNIPNAAVSGGSNVGDFPTDTNKLFISDLYDLSTKKSKTYSEGLKLLMDRTVSGTALSTENVKYSSSKRFVLSEYLIDTRQDLMFEYNGKWRWSLDGVTWIDVPEITGGAIYFEDAEIFTPEFVDLIKKLEGKDFLSGADLIFRTNIENSVVFEEKLLEKAEAESVCELCGDGFTNLYCDEAECVSLESQCVWEDGFGPFNSCAKKEIDVKCSSTSECQRLLGTEITNIAGEIKNKYPEITTNAIVRQDTGAKSFECLVLQLVWQESIGLNHCGRVEGGVVVDSQRNGNPLYCDGNINGVLKSGVSGEQSYGIMQVNLGAHPNVDVADFEKNVNYAIENVLIAGYNPNSKDYVCNGKSYSGWRRALRGYNGWNRDDPNRCRDDSNRMIGDHGYVENVIRRNSEVASLFPECR